MTAIRLVQTGTACPETYDAVTPDGTVAGTAHLLHGTFTVTAGDTVVYGKDFGDNYSVFATGQRERYLDIAMTKILEHLNAAPAPEPVLLAQSIAAALEVAAISEWDAGDGRVIEIYVSQIAPIVERILLEGGRS